jgi:Tfp pilus assembly protein PilF
LVAGDRAGAEARFANGSDAWDAGDRSGALASYRQAVAADPTFYPAQYNLAVVAMNLGDTVTAVQAAEASVLSDPLSASAHRIFAAALVQRDFPADAAEELETFLQLQPDDADVHLAVAGLYANKLGEPTRARAHYERVLALRPQHPQAAQVSAWLAGR